MSALGSIWRTACWPLIWLFGGSSYPAVERRTGPRALVRTGWFWVKTADGRAHTLPIGDKREHRLSTQCWCGPKIDGLLASHNAKDGRA